jgi:hypothetical protein
MKNQTTIKGNNNTVMQDTNHLKIAVNRHNAKNKWTIIGIIVSVLGVLIALIANLDKIIDFFN